uniref:Uncharacterized protein n=1 Tax=Glossina austeni TaxID=7395 RepID=A0A1A9UEV4_GLOAU
MNVYNTFNGTLCRASSPSRWKIKEKIHEHVHEDMYKRNRFQFPTNAEIRDNKLRSRAEQHAANIVVNGCYWVATVNYSMSISWLVSSKLWPRSALMNVFAVFVMKVYYEATILRVTNSLLSNADTHDGHIRLFNETEEAHHQHHHHNFSSQQLAEGTTNAALKIFYTKSLKTSLSQKQIEMCLPARNVQQQTRHTYLALELIKWNKSNGDETEARESGPLRNLMCCEEEICVWLLAKFLLGYELVEKDCTSSHKRRGNKSRLRSTGGYYRYSSINMFTNVKTYNEMQVKEDERAPSTSTHEPVVAAHDID